MDHSQVIIRPVVSEKSYVLAANDKYTFRVHPDAHKTQIRQAVEALFDVKVVAVRTARSSPSPSAAASPRGARALEEGDRPGARRRHDPDLPGPAGPRGLIHMPIRKPKPTSPGRRFSTYPDFAEVTKTEPEKSLVEGLTKSGGRNARGRKTSRHRGGGAKRLYRKIDFKRRKDGVPAKVAAIEYDPNRSAYIALLHYVDGAKAYILAPTAFGRHDGAVGRRRGDRAWATPAAAQHAGRHRGAQRRAAAGRGGQLARSAGAGVQLMAKEGD